MMHAEDMGRVMMTAWDALGELLPPCRSGSSCPLGEAADRPCWTTGASSPGPANPGGEAGCSSQLSGGGKAFFGKAYRKFERRFQARAEEEWS